MASQSLAALRAYVCAPGQAGGANQAESTVRLNVEHVALKATRFAELRLDKHMTIAALKHKLASHTGTAAEDIVRLTLLDSAGAVVARLDGEGDETKLGFFSPEDGFCLRFDDDNPCSLARGGWLEDTSLVQKYEMRDEDYDRREGTFREFARKRREQDPGWTLEKEMSARRNGGGGGGGGVAVSASSRSAGPPPPPRASSGGSVANPIADADDDDHQRDLASAVKPGDRCEVNPGGRRALVRFVGRGVDNLPKGFWVGVEYDEPVGKNDGRPPRSERRLFECAANHGGFVRPASVTVGDFPPADGALFDSEDEL